MGIDYSNFVFAAYLVAGSSLGMLFIYVAVKYYSLKSKLKNDQSK